MDNAYLPNDVYVARMPSPPRVRLLVSQFNNEPSVPPPCADWKRPEFLTQLDLSSCLAVSESQPVFWQYNNRYAAQKILHFLYLGPRAVARDITFLKNSGISIIVTVRHSHPSEAKPLPSILSTAASLGIETPIVDVRTDQSLISTLPAVIQAINNHMNRCNAAGRPSNAAAITGAALVCCDSGNERSPAIVIAYIMETFGVSLLQAHRIVQHHRFCVSISDSMRQTLSSYEDLVKARTDVEQGHGIIASTSTEEQPSRVPKRTLEADSDEDMERADDVARFQGRGFAPFLG